MADPYTVLGVGPNASEEEITRAYRKLAKRYHPDLNPGDKSAEQKMRQVNAAYEQIKNQKTGGASYERPDGSYGPQQQGQPGGGYTYRGSGPSGGFDFGDFEDIFGDIFGRGYSQQQGAGGTPTMQQAYMYIQARRYGEALRILSRISVHDAQWYYLSALANAGAGNRVTALSHAKEAVRREPGNLQYRQLLQQFEKGSYTYQQTRQSQGFSLWQMGRTIFQIILAQILCLFCCRCC
jgi:molecular chaperone DnaJ